jgi:hypothetical protein
MVNLSCSRAYAGAVSTAQSAHVGPAQPGSWEARAWHLAIWTLPPNTGQWNHADAQCCSACALGASLPNAPSQLRPSFNLPVVTAPAWHLVVRASPASQLCPNRSNPSTWDPAGGCDAHIPLGQGRQLLSRSTAALCWQLGGQMIHTASSLRMLQGQLVDMDAVHHSC